MNTDYVPLKHALIAFGRALAAIRERVGRTMMTEGTGVGRHAEDAGFSTDALCGHFRNNDDVLVKHS